jgi:hypothetical protein
MPELPIYPDRVREAPGYALERRLALQRDAPRAARDEAYRRLRIECVFETLRLTGGEVDRARVARPEDDDPLVRGQFAALEAVERAAGSGGLTLPLVREVHQSANPASDGNFRTSESKPQFRNVRPSSARFIEARLQDLLDWLHSESGRSMFPAERMALWFPRFLEISPFDRGNFRTAHLFLSFFSCVSGFPPVTLRLSEAEETRSDVESALTFDTYPLVRRFSEALARSLGVLEEARGSSSR